MNDDCRIWNIDERLREMFPNGLTQEQIDKANQEMWKENTFLVVAQKRMILRARIQPLAAVQMGVIILKCATITFFCGGCNRDISITEYPHDCPARQK